MNGSDITGEFSSTLLLPNLLASNGGLYTCVVTNEAGSDEFSSFLYISPYFTTQPTDTLTSIGASIALVCEAEAFPSPSYQWLRMDGQPIQAEIVNDTNMLVIPSVMFGDEGDYYCNASSLNDVIRSQDATITSKFSEQLTKCITLFLLQFPH